MMKKRMNKGFTLIELLAVIVILAVIALIATPIILGIIDDAKKNSFKASAYGIAKAAESNFVETMYNGQQTQDVTFNYVDGNETSTVLGRSLTFSGAKPQNGQVILKENGKVALALHDGKYCAQKGYKDSEITLSEKILSECFILADTSGASVPHLSTGMIPIKWDGSKWVKANSNNKDDANAWYNYDSQEWANVALVSEASRNNYTSASSGTAVLETDVMAYLVWIPRYKYKLFNVEALSVPVQEIEIVFENNSVTKSLGDSNGEWLTHPAFTFGTDELNGFWMGKFETTGDTTTPTIKPNQLSQYNQNVSTQFAISQLFNTTSTYGLTATNDSHMTKNIEWGAVAYLSQSTYGKYGNPIYTGAVGLEKEIYKNDASYYETWVEGDLRLKIGITLTGCAATVYNDIGHNTNNLNCPFNNNYYTTQGVKASTTGNIYGIYDMSGGYYENVMGAMYNDDNTTINVGSSGFDQATIDSLAMSKYIDKYLYGTTKTDQPAYDRRILGDATGEVYGWEDDYANYVALTSGWFNRGGHFVATTPAGIFAFNAGIGTNNAITGFRVTII